MIYKKVKFSSNRIENDDNNLRYEEENDHQYPHKNDILNVVNQNVRNQEVNNAIPDPILPSEVLMESTQPSYLPAQTFYITQTCLDVWRKNTWNRFTVGLFIGDKQRVFCDRHIPLKFTLYLSDSDLQVQQKLFEIREKNFIMEAGTFSMVFHVKIKETSENFNNKRFIIKIEVDHSKGFNNIDVNCSFTRPVHVIKGK